MSINEECVSYKTFPKSRSLQRPRSPGAGRAARHCPAWLWPRARAQGKARQSPAPSEPGAGGGWARFKHPLAGIHHSGLGAEEAEGGRSAGSPGLCCPPRQVPLWALRPPGLRGGPRSRLRQSTSDTSRPLTAQTSLHGAADGGRGGGPPVWSPGGCCVSSGTRGRCLASREALAWRPTWRPAPSAPILSSALGAPSPGGPWGFWAIFRRARLMPPEAGGSGSAHGLCPHNSLPELRQGAPDMVRDSSLERTSLRSTAPPSPTPSPPPRPCHGPHHNLSRASPQPAAEAPGACSLQAAPQTWGSSWAHTVGLEEAA